MEKSDMPPFIPLPQAPGCNFDLDDLVTEMRRPVHNGVMIIGKINSSIANHPKPRSLDYWLRQHAGTHQDTRQATDTVISAIVRDPRFTQTRANCPHTGRPCNAIRLI